MEPLYYTERQEHPKFKQYQAMPGDYEVKGKYILNQLGLGEVEEVIQVGGESQGTTWYSVKYFKECSLSSTFCPHPLLSILVRNLRFRALCHPADFLGDKSDVSLRHIGNFIELFTRHLEERFIHSV